MFFIVGALCERFHAERAQGISNTPNCLKDFDLFRKKFQVMTFKKPERLGYCQNFLDEKLTF